MTDEIREKGKRGYYLLLIASFLGMLSVTAVATTAIFALTDASKNGNTGKIEAGKHLTVFDVAHELCIKFAAYHGAADPAALVAAVRHSPIATLLISVAIEESRGDPVAVGSFGEEGAWQVKACDWGSVPKDIYGQAGQAEKIIRSLLLSTNGNMRNALARYNGGTTPPDKSYRYAERILKRAGHLQVAVNDLPPNHNKLLENLLAPHGSSLML